MISSENFFDQWVEQFVGPINYSVYVVGHLDREEAEIYWTENILKKREDHLVNINPLPEFDKVFEVCGGSMYLMDKFFDQYYQEPTDGLIYKDPTNFHAVIQEKRRILTALYAPDEVNSLEEVKQPNTVKNGELHDSLVWESSLHPVTYNTHREFCYTISIHRVYLITPKRFLGNTNVNPQLKLSH